MNEAIGVLRQCRKRKGFWIVTRYSSDESWLLARDKEAPPGYSQFVGVELRQHDRWPRPRPVRIYKIHEIKELSTLELCFHAAEWFLFESVVEQYLGALASGSKRIAEVLKKLNDKPDKVTREFLLDKVDDADILSPNAAPLWKWLSIERKWQVLQAGLNSDAVSETLQSFVDDIPEDVVERFWRSCPDSQLLVQATEFAPAPVKLRVLYPEITTIGIPKHQSITKDTATVVASMDDKDNELATRWMEAETSNESEAYKKAKMLSARAAEHAAAKFFKQLGFQVRDMAIQQLQVQSGEDWKKYDLLVHGKVPVDVKNARTTVNGPNSYAEFIVPQFKLDRNTGENVRITAVLSPYLQLKEFTDNMGQMEGAQRAWEGRSSRPPEDIRILGVTKHEDVAYLEQTFNTDILQVRFSANGANNTLPAWVFDFPNQYYADLNDRLEWIRNLRDEKIPPASLIASAGKALPVSAFLAAGRRPPDDWLSTLKSWEQEFVDSLLRHRVQTLPYIFATILEHFTRMISSPSNQDYDPTEYGPLISWGGKPLGRCDPLNTVAGLCDSLSILWKHLGARSLSQYSHFEFYGLGLLRGQDKSSERKTTLIAYCGGFVKDMGKCANPDLVLGMHGVEACDCGYLICPECGFCNSRCKKCEPRQAEFQQDRKDRGSARGHRLASLTDSDAWGFSNDSNYDPEEDKIPF